MCRAFVCQWSYQLRMDYRMFYVNFAVTTKQKLILDIQKIMRKESKNTTTENHKAWEQPKKKGTKDLHIQKRIKRLLALFL